MPIGEKKGGEVTGRQVTVKVVRGGREIREIERPLHVIDGRKAVVFRKKLWEVLRGNRIVIDGTPLAEKGNGQEKPPVARKITGGRTSGSRDVSEANSGTRAAKSVSGVQDSAARPVYTAQAGGGAPDAGPVQLSDEQKAKYAAALGTRGVPPAAFDPFKPWMAGLTLTVLPLMQQGYSPDAGVATELGKLAGPDKPRGALETVEFQLGIFGQVEQPAFLRALRYLQCPLAVTDHAVVSTLPEQRLA